MALNYDEYCNRILKQRVSDADKECERIISSLSGIASGIKKMRRKPIGLIISVILNIITAGAFLAYVLIDKL